jgi:hypothetical protein
VSEPFWSQALRAEVYTLHVLFMALILGLVVAAMAGLTVPRPIGPIPPSARGTITSQQQQAAAQDAKDAVSLGGGSDGKLTDLPDSVNKQVPILPQVQPRRCSDSYC